MGATGSIEPNGINFSNYLYWDNTTGATGAWVVGDSEIKLGNNSGQTNQGASSIAIGAAAGQTNQGASSIAIGAAAGQTNQGESSIAIGNQSGFITPIPSNTIVLNASGNTISILPTWTSETSGSFSISGNAVAYGNGTWIAVGVDDSNNAILRSLDDGINWTTASTSAGFISGYGVAYGNGTWVAVGAGGDTIQRSTDDGANWTAPTSGSFTSTGLGVAYGNGTWIAVGDDGGGVQSVRSSIDDGINWNVIPTVPVTINSLGPELSTPAIVNGQIIITGNFTLNTQTKSFLFADIGPRQESFYVNPIRASPTISGFFPLYYNPVTREIVFDGSLL